MAERPGRVRHLRGRDRPLALRLVAAGHFFDKSVDLDHLVAVFRSLAAADRPDSGDASS